MKITYDYAADTMRIDGKDFELKPYRRWLFQNHEDLVQGHFVKGIRSGHITKMTYDWQTIYHKASEYMFLNNYLDTL